MQFKKTRLVAGLAGLAAVATSVVGVASIDGASAATKVHTMKFVAIGGKSELVGHNKFVSQDVNRAHGKVVGYDTISGSFDRAAQTLSIDVALSRKGGLLYASLLQDDAGALSGQGHRRQRRLQGSEGHGHRPHLRAQRQQGPHHDQVHDLIEPRDRRDSANGG